MRLAIIRALGLEEPLSRLVQWLNRMGCIPWADESMIRVLT